MDPQRRAVAAELLTTSRQHDAAQEDRVARYRNLESESAELLGVLVRATAAQRILELGTSNGSSTMVEEVTALIEAEPAVTTALVPIGAGLRVVVKDGTP